MARRTVLSGILSGARAPAAPEATEEPAAKPAAKSRAKATKPAPVAKVDKPAPAKGRGTDLHGIKQQTLYLPEPVHEQLRELAYSERVRMHPLIMEGLDLLFQKRGLRSIAKLTSKN